ncbi:MAG: hypothetical protein ABEJ72_00240, partial [Candidatus Aenigmatarchaeota archaeon]
MSETQTETEPLREEVRQLQSDIEEVKKMLKSLTGNGRVTRKQVLKVVEVNEDGETTLTETGEELVQEVKDRREMNRRQVQKFFAQKGYPRCTSTVIEKMEQVS